MKVALRWLKPLGYADVIKKSQHTTCHVALTSLLQKHLKGNIQQLLESTVDFDSSIVLGVLVREEEIRELFNQRCKAVKMYLDNELGADIQLATNVHKTTLPSLLQKCLELGPDGNTLGFNA